MRTSFSLVSFALYLSLAAAAVISNAGDITARDDGGKKGTVSGINVIFPVKVDQCINTKGSGTDIIDDLLENVGEIAGTISVDVLPAELVDEAIKAAGGTPGDGK